MAGLASSVARLSLAVSAFGAQQAWNLLSRGGIRRAETQFYKLTASATNELAANPSSYAIQQIGDYFQRSAIDVAADLLTLRADRLDQRIRAASRQIAGAARRLTAGPGLTASIAELRNLFAVVNLVNQTTANLNLPPGPVNLPREIERAYSSGDYATLWVVEGLGREFTDRSFTDVSTTGLLTSGDAAKLPEKCLLMMHAGMGIAFARRIVGDLTPWSSRRDIAGAIRRFDSLVESNARPGYQGPAYESLGLVTRTWYVPMIEPLDRELWTANRPVIEYFWHGVGRAIYFNPVYMIPGRTPFEGIRGEARHNLALMNAVAGAAWAFAAVNVQRLDVLSSLFAEYANQSGAEQAFSNGLVSALMMRTEMIPGDPLAHAVCEYSPNAAIPDLAARWQSIVSAPSRRGIEVDLPLLRAHGSIGEIFRYHDLDQFVRHLEGTPS